MYSSFIARQMFLSHARLLTRKSNVWQTLVPWGICITATVIPATISPSISFLQSYADIQPISGMEFFTTVIGLILLHLVENFFTTVTLITCKYHFIIILTLLLGHTCSGIWNSMNKGIKVSKVLLEERTRLIQKLVKQFIVTWDLFPEQYKCEG